MHENDASHDDLPSGWALVDGKLHREFEFIDFSAAFAFMTRVAREAEKMDHHPDWSNFLNKVVIDLASHATGAVTGRDLHLAKTINEVVDA